jgi:hypothetical protein
MADNVEISAGTGTTIATDDTGGGLHFQRVKLVDGTADSTAAIAGDATYGLDVDVTRLPALPAGTNNIGDVDVLTVPAPLSTTGGGTEATALRVTLANDSTGLVSVDDNNQSLTVDAPVATPVFVRLSDGAAAITTLPVSLASAPTTTVTNGGTFETQTTGAALTALQLIDDPVYADDAAFTLATGKVMMSGGVAVAHGTNPTALTAARAGAWLMNRHHIPFVIGGHPNVVTYGMSITTAVTNAIIGPTIGAGLKFVATGLTVTTDNANTVFPSVVIGFGTASAPAFAGTPGTAKILGGHPGVPAGGGFTRGDGSGMIGVGADDEEVRITTVGTVTNMYVMLTGYTVES